MTLVVTHFSSLHWQNLLYMGQCVYVCICVCYRGTHCWCYRAEIWHGDGLPHGPEWEHLGAVALKMVSCGPHSPNGVFLGKLYKTKVLHCHQFKGGGVSGSIGCRTPRGPAACPSARRRSAAMVLWPIGSILGTWPQWCFGPRTPTPRVQMYPITISVT